ncbi:hypothetical protein CRENBAI_026721 [Crenichthys baileyi]|uniref:Uncharacterized protein n=1 Tax=Crenichthys baileyi TaxID=28760 RepID=A0AAV9SGI6_9TELE
MGPSQLKSAERPGRENHYITTPSGDELDNLPYKPVKCIETRVPKVSALHWNNLTKMRSNRRSQVDGSGPLGVDNLGTVNIKVIANPDLPQEDMPDTPIRKEVLRACIAIGCYRFQEPWLIDQTTTDPGSTQKKSRKQSLEEEKLQQHTGINAHIPGLALFATEVEMDKKGQKLTDQQKNGQKLSSVKRKRKHEKEECYFPSGFPTVKVELKIGPNTGMA